MHGEGVGVLMGKRLKLIADLRELTRRKSRDTESIHQEADQLLLRFINDPEVTAAYKAVPKWYA